MARAAVLRAVRVRMRPLVLALLAGLALCGCSAGTSPVEACVEHSVEEGVDRAAAQDACEAAVGE